METKVEDFIRATGIKQYFSGSLPYCVVNGIHVPIVIVNENYDNHYDKKTYMRSKLELDKYLLSPNPSQIILKKVNDDRLVLLNNCTAEDLDFSFTSKYRIRIAVKYSSFTTINEPIKYKAGNGLHIFDSLLSYDEIDYKNSYNNIPYFSEDHFRNNMAGGVDTTTNSHKYNSIRLTEKDNCKIPSYFFEGKPFFVNLLRDKNKELYGYFPKGLKMLGFDLNLCDKGGLKSPGTNMLCQSEGLEILNNQQIRTIMIENILKEL